MIGKNIELILERMNSNFNNSRFHELYTILNSFSLFLYNEYDFKIENKKIIGIKVKTRYKH